MYHAIVRRKVLSLFDAINRGDAGPVIDGFAGKFEHVFLGETALGGRRTSRAAVMEWYARLYRLLPDIRFTVHCVTVSGTPWNTLAVAEWTETNSGTDGVRTSATGIHVVHIAWGKMTRLHICPDTVMAKATLDRLAGKGVAEAAAGMIEGEAKDVSEPKRHHWWPQVQSSHWTVNGLVSVVRKDGSMFRTSPLNIGVESELYTRFGDDDAKDTSIESWLAETIDGPAASMIDFMASPPSTRRVSFRTDSAKEAAARSLGFVIKPYFEFAPLSPAVRSSMASYLAALLVRHPRYLAKLLAFHSDTAAAPSRNLALNNMLELYRLYRERIERAVIILLKRAGSAEFLYGDGGLVVQEPWRREHGIPFDIHAPITPTLSLQVLPTPFGDDLSQMPIAEVNNQGVARFNQISLGGAQRFVFARDDPPLSFIKKRFGIPAPRNIGYRIINGQLETTYDPSRK
jgi:ketosteroid isomerase-like protein